MNEKITLQELVELFARKCQWNEADAELFVKEFLALIEEALARDKYVKVKGLGTFKLINIEARKSVDVNTGEAIEIKGHTRVSFIPEAGLRDLINRPFAHFQSVLLKDEVHFADLPEEGGLPDGTEEAGESDMAEETVENVPGDEITTVGEESSQEGMQEEESLPVETEAHLQVEPEPDTVSSSPEQKPEESCLEVVADSSEEEKEESADVEAVVQEEKASGTDVTASERKSEELKEETTVETTPETDEAPEKSVAEQAVETVEPVKKEDKERHFPWCMIASVLLVGIFIGGLITWALTSGRRYMPEEVVEYLMKQERQQKSVPVVPDSVQLADTLTTKVDSSRMQVQPSDTVNKEKVVPGTPKKTETTEKTAAVPAKRETLADTVEYQITGTQASYTLRPGESLVRVALKFYGNKKLWPYLVKHNKSIIKNPDNVPVGTTIQIPQLTPKK